MLLWKVPMGNTFVKCSSLRQVSINNNTGFPVVNIPHLSRQGSRPCGGSGWSCAGWPPLLPGGVGTSSSRSWGNKRTVSVWRVIQWLLLNREDTSQPSVSLWVFCPLFHSPPPRDGEAAVRIKDCLPVSLHWAEILLPVPAITTVRCQHKFREFNFITACKFQQHHQ